MKDTFGIETADFGRPCRAGPGWGPTQGSSTWAILCTPFGRKVASLLASDGGIDYRWGLGLRSLAAAAGRKPASFHGADGADALQGIGQPWP